LEDLRVVFGVRLREAEGEEELPNKRELELFLRDLSFARLATLLERLSLPFFGVDGEGESLSR